MLRSYIEKKVVLEKKNRFVTALDIINCLQQIK